MSLDWYYTLDELASYRVDTKQGKERLEAQIKNLPSLLETAGISLPKRSRVLCLVAGSCLEAIAFTEIYHADTTCLDLQRPLLTIGVKEARKRRLKIRTIVGDIREVSKLVAGKFDLVTILGQPLPHIGIFDLDKAIIGVKRILAKKGVFLIDQTDLIFRILSQYRDAFTSNANPPVLNVRSSRNPRHGYFERLLYSRTKHVVAKAYLWAPWIIEYMLAKNGFAKVDVKPYVDPYSMMQTYLHAARN